jgi:hypothetical protein
LKTTQQSIALEWDIKFQQTAWTQQASCKQGGRGVASASSLSSVNYSE